MLTDEPRALMKEYKPELGTYRKRGGREGKERCTISEN